MGCTQTEMVCTQVQTSLSLDMGMHCSHQGTAPFLISPEKGLENLGLNVTFSSGCKDIACSDGSGFADAVKATQQAQAVVAVIGLDQGQER